MCGIIGYTGENRALPVLIDGLKSLEYRGYDSAGIAVSEGGETVVVKKKGRVSELEKREELKKILSCCGIGHTRWATHGEPSDENSHPHSGGFGLVSVVHNGIIENYLELKRELLDEGVVFSSETDTEVIAHLVYKYYQEEKNGKKSSEKEGEKGVKTAEKEVKKGLKNTEKEGKKEAKITEKEVKKWLKNTEKEGEKGAKSTEKEGEKGLKSTEKESKKEAKTAEKVIKNFDGSEKYDVKNSPKKEKYDAGNSIKSKKNDIKNSAKSEKNDIKNLIKREKCGAERIRSAVVRAAGRLKGTYAIAVLCADFPDAVIAAASSSPLVVGVGEGGSYLASDAAALLKYTDVLYRVSDGETAVLYPRRVSFFSSVGKPIKKTKERVDCEKNGAELNGYESFMLKEINEIPAALKKTLECDIFNEKVGIERDILGEKADIECDILGEKAGIERGIFGEKADIECGIFGEKAGIECGICDGKTDIEHGICDGKTKIERGICDEKTKIERGTLNGKTKIESGIFAEKTDIERGICDGKTKIERGAFGKKADVFNAEKIFIIGCGTAYHAGLLGRALIEKIARVPVETDTAGEFRYRDPIIPKGSLCIFISQSGETADTLAAARLAKSRGAAAIALTNVKNSAITYLCDMTLPTLAGPEIAVASTKAYNCQLLILYRLAFFIARNNGEISRGEYAEYLKILRDVSEKSAAKYPGIQALAARYSTEKNMYFLGRGLDYFTALEGALKLKEISYIHAEAYASGELKHGALALVEEGTPAAVIVTQGGLLQKSLCAVEEVKARRGRVIGIGKREYLTAAAFDERVFIPDVPDLFAPLISIVPAQLFAYYTAKYKGLDADKPRNLAKSVTVE
ncbi:MAG: isomerizing glutamine--fructose-6-phosphate transaminase [Clostridiales bacterium]|jgi:glucosamine 6-phosphate synthetase-like amidotransferase/phosphosugar isomerase protein|nr:isomerizing glutamine--fructose-6-phosphate transaminase [Clostridiales bacterium]